MKSKQNQFFTHELALFCKEHLPKALLSHLYLINLIQKQHASFYAHTGRNSLTFKLALINNDSPLYPTCISIHITEVYPENDFSPSILNTKKSTYTFCKKNLAQCSVLDENGVEQNSSNLTAYFFSDNAFIEVETNKAVKIIAETIYKAKPTLTNKQAKEEACQFIIF